MIFGRKFAGGKAAISTALWCIKFPCRRYGLKGGGVAVFFFVYAGMQTASTSDV